MADVATCGHIVWDTIRNNKDNLTALHETRAPAWVPEIEIRGTFSILLTCLVTLTACVYSAIHLNMPLKTGFWHTLTRKTVWVVVALVAPEIVVPMAMLQFYGAWKLSSDLQQLQKDADEDKVDKKFIFDLNYAFFIVMGGVRVHTPILARFFTSSEFSIFEEQYGEAIYGRRAGDRPVWQLTPWGLLDLARLGHWLYISPQRISDRSKADGLQKSLVLLQVSWMLASCVARKAYGLPLTLLEIHTMVHVVCAFVMYALWFKKPIDVRDPEMLDCDEERKDAIAYLCQRSLLDNNLCFAPRHNEDSAVANASACECGEERRVYAPSLQQKVFHADNDLVRHQRWHAAARAAQAVDPTRSKITSYTSRDQTAFRPRHGVFDNFESGLQMSTEDGRGWWTWVVGFSLCVIPILYGGIHLTAWGSEFPSSAERLMWRGSAISIMLTMLAMPWLYAFYDFSDNGCKDWLRHMLFFKDHDRVRSVIKWAVTVPVTLVLWLAASAVLIASIIGRFYLVIEAFISLRAVPVGAYWVPSWLKYIPHV